MTQVPTVPAERPPLAKTPVIPPVTSRPPALVNVIVEEVFDDQNQRHVHARSIWSMMQRRNGVPTTCYLWKLRLRPQNTKLFALLGIWHDSITTTYTHSLERYLYDPMAETQQMSSTKEVTITNFTRWAYTRTALTPRMLTSTSISSLSALLLSCKSMSMAFSVGTSSATVVATSSLNRNPRPVAGQRAMPTDTDHFTSIERIL